ncbi:M15 family metallopeptidase [Streptomyces anthocyanicus]|uniref:M15 family metallopeptidase n=1 Tax=Streptomyces anthocyanicus TaxID=68174 RepID=UPI00216B2DF7|nr:M15 family metallopeptidase [Streptomyces anthocyanicus]
MALLSTTALLVSGCSSSSAAKGAPTTPPGTDSSETVSARPSRTPSLIPTQSPAPSLDAVVTSLTDTQWSRMVKAGLWRKGCPNVRDQLRRVEMNFVGFDGEAHRGVLVVNADVTASVVRIFTRLFEERFPIRRMRPMEAYSGGLDASLADDNTSAFNCRRPDQINAPFQESPHANGRAIDINPLENPWINLRTKKWSPSAKFAERTEGKGKILKGGLVWSAFTEEDWLWQDIKVPDYMHFDTGYPSKPFKGPNARPATAGPSAVDRSTSAG